MATEAWEQVERAASAAGVEVRALETLDDCRRVADVVGTTWGLDSMSPELVRAFQHAGSSLFGAESDGEFVGFVLGFVGVEHGLHVHSHMLAVLPDRQARGVGYALKLAQRAWCLDHGIDEVRWTFDPLIARNGRFNLVKLGATASSYLPRFYGDMRDAVNRGDRSDRFEVRWRLTSPRVEAALEGTPTAPAVEGDVLLEPASDAPDAEPARRDAAPAPGARVRVPMDYLSLRSRWPDVARGWREGTGEVFASCFDAGLCAVWMERDGTYVFDRAEG